MAENNNIMDEIRTINSIPICDMVGRADLESLKSQLANKADINHTHDEYMTKTEANNTFVTKDEIDDLIANAGTNIDLSKYVTKTELENKKYLTQSDASSLYATKVYVDQEINKAKQYAEGLLKDYATKEELEVIRRMVIDLEIRIQVLEESDPNVPDTPDTQYCNITYTLGEGVTSNNNTKTIMKGSSYAATLTCDRYHEFEFIKVAMNSIDITPNVSTEISGTELRINIPEVTGNITIIATSTANCTVIRYTTKSNPGGYSHVFNFTNPVIESGPTTYDTLPDKVYLDIVHNALSADITNTSSNYISISAESRSGNAAFSSFSMNPDGGKEGQTFARTDITSYYNDALHRYNWYENGKPILDYVGELQFNTYGLYVDISEVRIVCIENNK